MCVGIRWDVVVVGRCSLLCSTLKKLIIRSDNTNRDAATRKYYVDLAKKHGIPIRCETPLVVREDLAHGSITSSEDV